MIDLWAPSAGSVEIEIGPPDTGRVREAMQRADDGWWHWGGDVTAYGGVFDYAFVLDGHEPALPDPRSAWQPHGVHGPSRFFDPASFAWTDGSWRGTRGGEGVLGGVVYELHVGTFTETGDLDAALERLDHLVELGVDVVEVLPVAAFPGAWGWGYDGVALYAVHDRYGGPAALQRFVDACHGRGLGVCLDVVYNHLGPSGNYLSRFGPYFTDTHETPWGPAVNLDAPGSEHVREFVVGNALRWLRDFHIDALRLDAVHELKDDSERHVLAELSDRVAELAGQVGRPLDLIAESDLNDIRMVTPTAEGGLGMTAQWDDDVHHGLHVALTRETQGYYHDFGGLASEHAESSPLAVLAKTLRSGFFHDGSHSTFRRGPWGAPVDPERLDARRLLGYLQTHDQVGNRATGDRISATLSGGQQAIGSALYLLSPFTPMVFAGEEWAASSPWQFFTGFDDEALAEAVRAGRRAEFAAHGWRAQDVPDPQDPATRRRSVLRWHELGLVDHARVLDWYAALVRLRRARLGGPTRLVDVSVELDEAAEWLVMTHRELMVVTNFAVTAQTVPVGCRVGEAVLAWDDGAVDSDGVRLHGHDVAVFDLG